MDLELEHLPINALNLFLLSESISNHSAPWSWRTHFCTEPRNTFGTHSPRIRLVNLANQPDIIRRQSLFSSLTGLTLRRSQLTTVTHYQYYDDDDHHHHYFHLPWDDDDDDDDDDDAQNRKSVGADWRIIAHGAGSPGCRVKRWRQLAVTTSWGGGL